MNLPAGQVNNITTKERFILNVFKRVSWQHNSVDHNFLKNRGAKKSEPGVVKFIVVVLVLIILKLSYMW